MRTKKISLVVVPLLLTACSGSKTLQQDVYSNQYDCYQDWDYQLCEPEEEYQSSSSSGGGYVSRYIGPQYYKNNRKVKRAGRVITAYGNRSISSKISYHVHTQAKSTPIRGGFGRGGSSFGG